MKRRVRFGIIGCGGIANGFHLKDLSQIEEAELVACADVRREAAEATAKRWGAGASYDNHRQLLDRDDLDAVIVATHHATHAAIAVDVLESGRHVLVQKPLTTKLEDAHRLVAAAEARPRQKVQCLPFNWTSGLSEAARLLKDGAIGRPCQSRRRIAHPGPGRDSWFYNPEIAGFGASFDMGVYAVSGLTALMGPAVSVSALVGTFEEGVRIDDNATWQLRFASGAFGTAETAWTELAHLEGTLVYGTEGVLALNVPPHRSELRLFRRTGGVSFQSRGEWLTIEVPADPTAAPHRHFVQAILEDRPPLGTPQHARHVTEILLAGHESNRTGQRITLRTSF
jgi:UDP-N-acetyl-2-amino-2-deoxyglucuronate dehydrogenase